MVKQVAVLGAGIMGASTALLLARRGVRVVVFDGASRPMDRASRLYDPSVNDSYDVQIRLQEEQRRRADEIALLFVPKSELQLYPSSARALAASYANTAGRTL